jgi:hypothetical protein
MAFECGVSTRAVQETPYSPQARISRVASALPDAEAVVGHTAESGMIGATESSPIRSCDLEQS